MTRAKFGLTISAFAMVALLVLRLAGSAHAQSASVATPMLRLYVDPKTKQVFTESGKGRVLLATIPVAALDPNAIEQRVEQKTHLQLEENQQQMLEITKRNQQLESDNLQLVRQVAEITPAWRSYIDNFQSKIRIGALVYADWRLYSHTGFGPQEQENLNTPGPGNNIYNSFDISRAYLNFFFFPTDDFVLRVTPDIYATRGVATADKIGKVSAIGSNLDGNLALRLKFAYLQYKKPFAWNPNLKEDTITVGMINNPLISWEEDLWGYRFVTDPPWNYTGLSSAQFGVSMQGPITFNERQYIDYDFGAFSNGNYHQYDQTNTKQVMGRVSVYPFGAKWRFDGLGATFFYDYGYGNVAPDTVATTSLLHGKTGHITRGAALLHYDEENWGLIAEYDWGHNAFTGGNLFSSSGPVDYFGVGTSSFAGFSKMATGFLENGKAVERGLDFMGHYHIPRTPFTLFGLFQWFQPNTKVNLNPLDFQRWVAGISYQYNEYLRFAIDSQNLLFYHSQTDVPEDYVNSFAPVFTKPKPGAMVADAVPRDTHAFFLNMEFNY